MAGRPNKHWEDEMRSEYLAVYHREAKIKLEVRLGSVPAALVPEGADEVLRRAYGNIRLWADAIAIYPRRLVLIETKIKPKPGIISTMEIYHLLLPQTPELVPYLDRPVELEMVYSIVYPLIIAEATARGIRCVQFLGSRFLEYLRSVPARETMSPLPPIPS